MKKSERKFFLVRPVIQGKVLQHYTVNLTLVQSAHFYKGRHPVTDRMKF